MSCGCCATTTEKPICRCGELEAKAKEYGYARVADVFGERDAWQKRADEAEAEVEAYKNLLARNHYTTGSKMRTLA